MKMAIRRAAASSKSAAVRAPRATASASACSRQFVVVRHGGEWAIRHNGDISEKFKEQKAALREAIARADKCSKDGKPAQVLSQTEDRFEVAWTYGKDAPL
jgi:hypothetical protein